MTVTEIAKRAGVSPATVSRVLNGKKGVQRHTELRVFKALQEYKGDFSKANIVMNTHKLPERRICGNIALVFIDETYDGSPAYSALIRGCEIGAADNGFNLIVSRVDEEYLTSPAIRRGEIDGFLIAGWLLLPRIQAKLRERPAVWLTSHGGGLEGNYSIGKMAAEYLIDKGHRELIFLSAWYDYPAMPVRAESFEFYAGKNDARCRIITDQSAVCDHRGRMDIERLRSTLERLVDEAFEDGVRKKGIFIPHDLMAAVTCSILSRRNIQLGEDVDVITCGTGLGYLLGVHPRPALIDINAEQMGRSAVDLLVRQIKEPHGELQIDIVVRPTLVAP